MTYRQKHIRFSKRPVWLYKAMLLFAALIWGLGTITIKDSVADFSALWVVALRFLGAGIILVILFWKRISKHITKDMLVASAFLGVLLGLCYMGNSAGLAYITASVSAVLSSAYAIIIVFIGWAILHIRPTIFNILAALLCLSGIALATLSNNTTSITLGQGEILTLLGALAFAFHIVYMGKFSQTRDALTLTILQLPIVGIFSALVSLIVDGPLPYTQLMHDAQLVRNIAYLTIMATVVAITLQNIGIAHVAPSQASLLLSTETVFAILFAILFLHEHLTWHIVVGFILVMAGIVISETMPHKKRVPKVND